MASWASGGSREEGGDGSAPLSLVNGIYVEEGLLPGPDWTGLERHFPYPGHHERRVLDLEAARWSDSMTEASEDGL
jgi:hypothetical protein